jgi:hypothetical protein
VDDELSYLLSSQWAIPSQCDGGVRMRFVEQDVNMGLDLLVEQTNNTGNFEGTGVWQATPVQGQSKDRRLQRLRSLGPRRRHKLYKVSA